VKPLELSLAIAGNSRFPQEGTGLFDSWQQRTKSDLPSRLKVAGSSENCSGSDKKFFSRALFIIDKSHDLIPNKMWGVALATSRNDTEGKLEK